MDRFLIEGRHPLEGTTTPAGNKNEALPVLAASLLVAGEVVVENVPRIEDVSILLDALRQLGVQVQYEDPHTLRLDATRLNGPDFDAVLASRIRGSVLMVPGLLAPC